MQEARLARALDRLEPLLHNYHTGGRAWREHGVTADRVLALNEPVLADGAPALAEYATRMIRNAVEKGYLTLETQTATGSRSPLGSYYGPH